MLPVTAAGDGASIRAAAVVSTFDGQGWHRTGSGVDRRSGRWLAREAADRGARCRLEDFSLERLVAGPSFVELDGWRVVGLPLFDSPLTGPEGVSGILAELGSVGAVGLARAGPGGQAACLEQARRSGSHAAIVLVTECVSGGLAPRNAEQAEQPFGTPVLQVGAARVSWLQRALESRRPVRVVTAGRRVRARAANVVGDVGDAEEAGAVVSAAQAGTTPAVVVLTPRSGWWHCAAERGGGLACWLELVGDPRLRRSAGRVQYIATSGHELGYLGLRRFLEGPSADREAPWLHLGANLGARGEPVRVTASHSRLGELGVEAMRSHGCSLAGGDPLSAPALGEASVLATNGISYVSLVAGSPLFHQRADRWPGVVDVEELARLAGAAGEIAAGMTDLAGGQER